MAMLAFLAAVFPALTSASGSLRGPAAGRTLQQPVLATWMPPKPADKSCLSYYPAGCYSIHDQGTCLRSKDGRDRVAWSGLKIYAEPCVWCGGRQCTNNSTNLCEPYDFLYRGQGIGFASFLNRTGFQVASCGSNGQLAPVAAVAAPAVNLLSSCAAHSACAAQGLSGECCPTSDNTTLACCASAPTAVAATPAPSLAVAATELAPPPPPDNSWWQTPEPTPAETSCLMPHLFGCHVVVSREVCLGSKDARANATLNGLKIYGQPCVWCGGVPCRSGAANLCEPLDFLMHGEGTAFHIFYDKASYQAASCVDGKPAPARAIFRHPPYPPMPTLAPLPQWWVPQHRPAEAGLTCLKDAAQGCNQLQDMVSCLSSRDGRPVPSFDGLKIHGEPCVWCGGGHCTSNSSSVCEPYDYVMRGEGTAFSVFWPKTSFMVANCHAGGREISLPEDYPTDCLEDQYETAAQGCSSLGDAASCLSSVDGRTQETVAGLKMRGQPCVWCGGFPCTDASSNMCEPFDFLMNGRGKAYNHFYGKHVYRVAGCKNGRPSATSLSSFPDVVPGLVPELGAAPELLPFWVAKKPKGESTQCLRPAPNGCRSLKSMEWCMTSKDASSTPSIMGLKVAGEPCVWCGGGPCTSNGTSLCEPFDFAMYGEGVAYKTFIAKGIYKVAECLKPLVPLPPFNYSCLAPVGVGHGGCNSAWDAETCLASKDGSSVDVFGNLKVRNQPCVWCGGVSCHSGKNSLCEAFDYAMNGESTAFDTFHAPDTFRIAACLDGQPKAATLKGYTDYVPGWTYKPIEPMIPEFNKSYWKSVVPPVSERACLMHHWYGCDKIGHEQTCLGSLDAQSQALFGPSIQIEGQPCVWCGGVPCISGSSALCQPFDLLMNGEGKNFTTFYAKNHYQVARCEGGHPQPLQQTPTSAPWDLVPFPPPRKQDADAAAGAAAGATANTTQMASDSSPAAVVPVAGQASATLAPSIGTFSGVDPHSPVAIQPAAAAIVAPVALPGAAGTAAPAEDGTVAGATELADSPAAGGTVAAVPPPAALSTAAPAAASDMGTAAPSSDREVSVPGSTASPSAATTPSVPIMPIAMSTLGPLLPVGMSTAAPAEAGTTAPVPAATSTVAPAEASTPVTLPAVISTIAADISTMQPAALSTAAPDEASTPVTLPAVISTIAADISTMQPAALSTATPDEAGTSVTLPAVISTIAADMSTMQPAALSTAAPDEAGTPVTLPAVISTIAADISTVLASTSAPDEAGTEAPVTLPAVLPVASGTMAPVTLPALSTTVPAASGVSTAGPSADREVSVPGSTAGQTASTDPSVPNMPVAVSTLGPLPPIAIITAAPSSASTAAPAATIGGDAPGAEPASLSTLAPVPTLSPLPTLPPPGASVPAVAPADCWVSCGKAGLCAACGEGKACCRPGFAGDPAVCSNASGYDSKWSYHQCVVTTPAEASSPAESSEAVATPAPAEASSPAEKNEAVTTPAPAEASSPAEKNASSAPVVRVRDGDGPGPAAFDMTTPLPGEGSAGAAEFRNASNETNGTLVVAHEQGSGGSRWWVWLLLCIVLLAALGALLVALGLFGGKKASRKSKKKRASAGASRDLEDSADNESINSAASASEMEMHEPLVQQRGASDDIFDQIDANHDGMISNAEWNRAMGVPQPTTVVSPGFQGMPMANAAASTTAPVSTMRAPVPPGVMAAPAASQPAFAIPVLAPAATLQPGMVVPRPIYRN